jgi:Secretion system C-terminal sorting domain
MKKSKLICLIAVLLPLTHFAQNPVATWDSIKSAAMPQVDPAFQSVYGTPYRQPLADYGWEDGLEISSDGLHLYALFSPIDLVSWNTFVNSNLSLPLCSLFANMDYLRPYASTFGMDLTSNFFGCDSIVNIDIVYANRASIMDPFNAWQLSGIARGQLIEGGPSPLFSDTNPANVDLFFFTGNNDIYVIRNTTANPNSIATATRLPSPINPDSSEFNADNAHIQRLNGDSLILIYEKYTDPGLRTFMFSLSPDLALTWSTPIAITTVTNSLGHIEHPHLNKDALGQWWLYYSLDLDRIVRSRLLTPGNWDSWDVPETILTKGNAISIGEPTVTETGDISFSLAYQNQVIQDSTDVYDLDPWFLPNLNTISREKPTQSANLDATLFPNPFSNSLSIKVQNHKGAGCRIELITPTGVVIQRSEYGDSDLIHSQNIPLDVESLKPGIYIVKVESGQETCFRQCVKL